jgi:predicted phosphodiesterase
MKIAILSDIHGNLVALQAVLRDIAQQGVDQTVNLGDILSGPLNPAETADLLMSLDLPTIRGNHERQLLSHPPESMGASDRFAYERLSTSQLDWIKGLPLEMQLDGDILLVHGAPADDLQYLLETVDATGVRPASVAEITGRIEGVSQEMVVCGHTHIPRSLRLPDGRHVINPGSVGLQAYEDINPAPHVVQTGSPEARYAIVERKGTDWSIDLRKVAYGHRAAADLARRNGRPDWAVALRTGVLQAPY